MEVQSDKMDSFNDENSSQLHGITNANLTPTSPLDLSKTSTRYPFIPRSTSIENAPSSPVDLSAKTNHNDDRSISPDNSCEAPIILTGPKPTWHYRSIKDLAKKHIPFLPGDGPQRTPIRIKVPPISNKQMYLGIAVLTHDEQFHDSKVIVPAKTKVNKEHISHKNDLNCLQFDECYPTDYFHPTMRHVYLQITAEEHRAQSKDVRIYMFNLYQNQIITKDIIEAKQLHLCRLAFWFCVFDNQYYIPISRPSLSCVIQENRASVGSFGSQQTTNQTNLPSSYSMLSMDYTNQVDTDNDCEDGDDTYP